MCKLCVCIVLLATLALAESFFLPIFVRKQAPQTPAVNNVAWSPPQSTYKDFSAYSTQGATPLQPVAMPSMQQYSYDVPSMSLNPYHQMQPQFHNVQLVPCLCPLTRDVIEHQAQSVHPGASQVAATDGTKSVVVQGSHKATST